MKKLAFSVAIGAAVVLGAAAVAGASAGGGGGGGGKVLHLVARQTQAAELPAPNPESFLGTRFVGADDVFRGSRRVGTSGRSCEVVATAPDRSATFQCVVTLALDDGTLALQALPRFTETGLEGFEAAVTGGTGAYQHARGSARVDQASGTEIRYRIDLR